MLESRLTEFRNKNWLNEVRINGKWMVYGLCAEDFNTRLIKGEYLGISKEIRIDGTKQNPFKIEYHFWMKAEE